MTPFPKIQSSCPYLDRLDSVIDAGYCRMCRREVHDLTAMDEGERADFLASCGNACVSYRMDVKPALAAALIAASAAVLVVPEAVLAASHQAARSHHRQRPVQVPTVRIMTAGMIAPPLDHRADPAPPPPSGPPSPLQKPE